MLVGTFARVPPPRTIASAQPLTDASTKKLAKLRTLIILFSAPPAALTCFKSLNRRDPGPALMDIIAWKVLVGKNIFVPPTSLRKATNVLAARGRSRAHPERQAKTACPTRQHQQFASRVGQAFSLLGLLSWAASVVSTN